MIQYFSQKSLAVLSTAAREGSMHDQDPHWAWRAVGGWKFATNDGFALPTSYTSVSRCFRTQATAKSGMVSATIDSNSAVTVLGDHVLCCPR